MSKPLKDFRLGIDELTDLALAASAQAFLTDKQTIARQVLDEWARKKLHEHTVFARGLIANGMQPELPGFALEDAGSRRQKLR